MWAVQPLITVCQMRPTMALHSRHPRRANEPCPCPRVRTLGPWAVCTASRMTISTLATARCLRICAMTCTLAVQLPRPPRGIMACGQPLTLAAMARRPSWSQTSNSPAQVVLLEAHIWAVWGGNLHRMLRRRPTATVAMHMCIPIPRATQPESASFSTTAAALLGDRAAQKLAAHRSVLASCGRGLSNQASFAYLLVTQPVVCVQTPYTGCKPMIRPVGMALHGGKLWPNVATNERPLKQGWSTKSWLMSRAEPSRAFVISIPTKDRHGFLLFSHRLAGLGLRILQRSAPGSSLDLSLACWAFEAMVPAGLHSQTIEGLYGATGRICCASGLMLKDIWRCARGTKMYYT
jgi:hypothetical protein